MLRRTAPFLVAAALGLAGPVDAWSQPARPQTAAPPSAAAQPAAPQAPLQAPYDPQLIRLAEIMGALHYLRTLCDGPETGAWRREMQALLDAEAPGGDRRERLVQSFNHGYSGFERTYRTCTPAARLATRRFVEEGRRIVVDISSRFVN
ncbi:TIGR02301 family protein [Phreatobacter sp.]|uniref:TIGR02301 family protein n=1 Tax=Phreatobacter sp. TaxID=1966341 RepID=UPI003F72D020